MDLSVLVAVLAGTLVLLYLSETFGWSFGGLVVPGYLATVLVVSPPAGATVLVEAGLTATLVVLLSDLLARSGLWSPFFGRERFLLLVVVSVLVRQACEVWLLPELVGRTGLRGAAAQDAHSVGLVLVPLTANALGRDTLTRGLAQVLVPVAVAYALLHLVLLPFTNLSLGSMVLTYEDVSLDFLQSGRAYFVLLTGAVIAARLNGALAWSAGGILIPALLGLAWYEPLRILTTVVEAAVLVGAYRALVRIPGVRHLNLEGARKLALLFVLSAGFRIGVAWVHDLGLPVRSDGLSGLGYLLSALIAAKVLQTGALIGVVGPALATSLAAFLAGNAAAWAVEQGVPGAASSVEAPLVASTSTLHRSPEGAAELARVRTRLDPTRGPPIALPAADLVVWRSWWRDAGPWLAGGAPPEPPSGLELRQGEGTWAGRVWWLLQEREERPDRLAGWGTALVRPGGAGPILVVERPWSGRVAGVAARCEAVDCVAVYIAGVEVPSRRDDALDGLGSAGVRPMEVVVGDPPATDAAPPSTEQYGELVARALREDRGAWTASPGEMSFLTESLAPAVAGWTAGRVSAAEVARLAGLVDADVRVAVDPDATFLVVLPRAAGVVLVARAGPAAPIALTVPHPRREVGTARIAFGGMAALGARYLLLDPALPAPPRPVTENPLHALHLGLRRALAGEPEAGMFEIRGLGDGEGNRPTEDVVIGAGRPVLAAPPPALLRLLEGGRLAGAWTVRWAAARADEADLSGGHLPALQADLTFGGVTPAVLWFSEAARTALRSEERAAIADWLGAAGVPFETCGATDVPAPGGPATSDPHIPDLLRRAAEQHNLNLVRRLRDTGVVLRGCWDPARQLAFLEARSSAVVSRSWVVPGARPAVRTVAEADALRSAVGWSPADLHIERAP